MIDRGLFCALARRVLLVACLPIGLGMIASAQGGRGGGGSMGSDSGNDTPLTASIIQMPEISKVDHDLKQLTKLLALTTDQQAQLKDILTDRNQKTEDLIKRYKAEQKKRTEAQKDKSAASKNQPGNLSADMTDPRTIEASQAYLRAIRVEAQTKIVALLTDSQKTSYDAWKAKHAKSEAQQEAEEFRPINSSGSPGIGGGPGGGGPGGGGPGGGGPGGGGPGL